MKMLIDEHNYLDYIFMIKQKMIDNKIKANGAMARKYEGWKESYNYHKSENMRLFDKWKELNRPKNGTPNGHIEFYNATEEREIKRYLI